MAYLDAFVTAAAELRVDNPRRRLLCAGGRLLLGGEQLVEAGWGLRWRNNMDRSTTRLLAGRRRLVRSSVEISRAERLTFLTDDDSLIYGS